MQVYPLYDRVVVLPAETNETTASGIVVAGGNSIPDRGTVVATGPGHVLQDGTVNPLMVEVGHEVLFEKNTGLRIKVGDEDLLVFREIEILGVISDVYPFAEPDDFRSEAMGEEHY